MKCIHEWLHPFYPSIPVLSIRMKRGLIIAISSAMTVSLLLVIWTKIALSRWIVRHSGVEDLMIKEGRNSELFFKDLFFHYGAEVMWTTGLAGGVLLWLLNKELPRK